MFKGDLHRAGISGVLVIVAATACGTRDIRSEPIGASDDTRSELAAAVQLHADTVMTESLHRRRLFMSAPAEAEVWREEKLGVIDLGELDDDDVHVDKPDISIRPRFESSSPKAKTTPMIAPGGDTSGPPRSASEVAESPGWTNRRLLEDPTPGTPKASPPPWAPTPLSPSVPVETTPSR